MLLNLVLAGPGRRLELAGLTGPFREHGRGISVQSCPSVENVSGEDALPTGTPAHESVVVPAYTEDLVEPPGIPNSELTETSAAVENKE